MPGFDAEAKPAAARGEVCTGPHLIQLATEQLGYLFPVGLARMHAVHAGFNWGTETAWGNGGPGLSTPAGPGT